MFEPLRSHKYFFLLLALLPGCVFETMYDETPWCTQAVRIEGGLLFPTGRFETGTGKDRKILFLPTIRDDVHAGLALSRLLDGSIIVSDVALGGPAARAGIRPGQIIIRKRKDFGPKDLIKELAENTGRCIEWNILDGDITKKIRLTPVDELAHYMESGIPFLLCIKGGTIGLDLTIAFDLIRIKKLWTETKPGCFASPLEIRLFWGLIAF